MAYLGVLERILPGAWNHDSTTISQIFEQVINAVISVVAAGVLFKIGLDSNRGFTIRPVIRRHSEQQEERSAQVPALWRRPLFYAVVIFHLLAGG